MLYPKCPKCGGTATSAESAKFDKATSHFGKVMQIEAMRGHPHPYVKMARLAVVAGREIYKRAPGCGSKVCTRCGHAFR